MIFYYIFPIRFYGLHQVLFLEFLLHLEVLFYTFLTLFYKFYLNDYINNLYIGTDDNKIKLDINETFVNDALVFDNNNATNGSDTKKDYDIYIEIPAYIIDNFKYNPAKEVYYTEEKYKDNIYNVQYNVNNYIITLATKNNDIIKIWQYSLKDKRFINYVELNKNEILSSYDISQIENLSNSEYNNYFRNVLNYLNNIIK